LRDSHFGNFGFSFLCLIGSREKTPRLEPRSCFARWPTLATIKPSRRWGTRLWCCQTWATQPKMGHPASSKLIGFPDGRSCRNPRFSGTKSVSRTCSGYTNRSLSKEMKRVMASGGLATPFHALDLITGPHLGRNRQRPSARTATACGSWPMFWTGHIGDRAGCTCGRRCIDRGIDTNIGR
jgi:hypothetical protein